MLSSIIYTNPARRALLKDIVNEEDQTRLWTYGISGDLPIATIRITNTEQLEMVRQMLSIHEYWQGYWLTW